MTPREWDAATYDRVATPQARWAVPLLEHLDAGGIGAGRVLDAGCGSGRVSQAVLDRLPGAHLVALDGSQAMLDEAARRLAPAVAAGRVTFVHADMALPLPLDRPVDAIVSTAAFHWVTDHDALFHNLAAVLRPGGQLVAQCGGAGNVASVVRAMADIGDTWEPWHFPTAEEAADRLVAHGFTDVRTSLHTETAAFDTDADLEEYLATVVLGTNLTGVAPGDRPTYVRQVAARLPDRVIDYVRLNLLARRAAG